MELTDRIEDYLYKRWSLDREKASLASDLRKTIVSKGVTEYTYQGHKMYIGEYLVAIDGDPVPDLEFINIVNREQELKALIRQQS